VFATMRRKRRNAKMKDELNQSVDHLKRAATIAAQGTSATVGPKLTAAKDRVQPAATMAKGAASTGWESAVATITPLVAVAGDSLRQTGKVTKKQAKANRKSAKRNAAKLDKRANKKLGRKKGRSTGARLVRLALVGAAVGAGTAYVMRKRKAAQWDEYDPSAPIAPPATVGGADDAAFEPADSAVVTEPGVTSTAPGGGPEVARLSGSQNKD
jgi:hypothetical protein